MKTMILKSVFFICKALLKSCACKCSKHLGAITKFKVSDKCSIVSSAIISKFNFYVSILVYDLYRSINLLLTCVCKHTMENTCRNPFYTFRQQ